MPSKSQIVGMSIEESDRGHVKHQQSCACPLLPPSLWYAAVHRRSQLRKCELLSTGANTPKLTINNSSNTEQLGNAYKDQECNISREGRQRGSNTRAQVRIYP